MTFVANDTLSELVWSPHRGLSLRCAAGSVPKRKSSVSGGIGPDDTILSPSHTIGTETNHDKVAEERTVIPPPTTSKDLATIEAAALSLPSKSSAENIPTNKSDLGCESGSCESVNTSARVNNVQDDTIGPYSMRNDDVSHQDLEDGRPRNFSPQSNDQVLNARPVGFIPGDFTDRKARDSFGQNEDGEKAHPLSDIKSSSFQETRDLRKSKYAMLLQPSSQCQGTSQSNTLHKEDGESKMTAHGFSSVLPLDKLECVAENDVQLAGTFQSDSALEIGNSWHDEEHYQLMVYEISKASPIRALASETKGKGKTLSNGDLEKGASEKDDDSYGSFESCNSAGMSSAGKKRALSYEERLTTGSKRLKMQIQETPDSTCLITSNGSFSNWISTMIKGLSRSNEDGPPSLAHPSNRNGKKELVTCSGEQDNKCVNMGFQSIFQSLHRPNQKVEDERLLTYKSSQISEGCKELKLTNNSIEAHSSLLMSNLDDLVDLKQNIVLNESLNQSVPGASQDPLVHSTVLKGNVVYVPLDSKTGASSKRFSSNPNFTAAGDVGCSQNFITGEKKTDVCGKNCSDLPSAEKLVHASVNRNDHLNSFLITHFCPKSSRAVMSSAQCKQGSVGTAECATDSSRLVHNSQSKIECFKDSKNVESQGHLSEEPTNSSCNKLHRFPLDVEASYAMKEIEGQNINQILRSQRFERSEAIASVFAKRWDALKHIMPTDLKETTSSPTACFFCGITGHDLRHCPQVTETEVDELLKNITAYGGVEESPCLCIRCFQLNHWAVACPNALSRKKPQLKDGAAHLHNSSSTALWHQKGFERNLSFPDGIVDQTEVLRIKTGCASSLGCYRSPRVSNSPLVNLETKQSLELIRKVPSNVQKVNAASCEENASKLSGFSYPCTSLAKYILDIPAGIFEAVKGLQLSRTDVMRWMSSVISMSLDGYYLRLRLGKLGESLGGSGYYVACICGAQVGKLAESSKRPISVIIGGIRCSVQIQYVSNQDFLEDELKAWWSATLRSDGKIPSEDELRSKVEERRRLGL